jgi:hypothetical protein
MKEESYTLFRDIMGGDAMSIVWISVWTGLAACSLIFSVAFCNACRNKRIAD